MISSPAVGMAHGGYSEMFMKIVIYVLYFFFYSAVGWLGESIYCSVGAKKWINRGFLTGPMCPIYGTGAIAMSVLLTPVKSLDVRIPVAGHDILITPLLVFLAGMVVCDVVEFITSVLMEKLFHARWWDYSNNKFNIQGRICLKHTIYWGIASLLFLYIVHPIVEYCFSRLLDSAAIIIFACVLAIFLVDLAHAVYKAIDVRKFMDKLNKASGVLTGLKDNVKSNLSEGVDFLENKRDALIERFEHWRTETYAQFKDMLPSFPGSNAEDENGEQKKKSHANRHFKSSSNLLPQAHRQIKKLEEMFEEIKKAFNDDNDEDLY